jgi:hypothetical protein
MFSVSEHFVKGHLVVRHGWLVRRLLPCNHPNDTSGQVSGKNFREYRDMRAEPAQYSSARFG